MVSRSESFQPSPIAFEQLAVLAVSRMATVELCRVSHGPMEGQVVAVKRLPFDLVEDPQLRAMFRDEIWMASGLHHPNVTRVLSWGEDENGPYLVVEFVRGVSLSRLMRTVFTTGEAFTERLIVFLASGVCGGLAAAHSLRADNGEFLNLVHREVTPGNILMGFDGDVKIADFGLAKAKQRITQTAIGITKGEPAYMSPEQVCGQQLDGRSDIFALGVLLYELFAQRRPWTVTNVKHALAYIVEGESPDLGAACPNIDRALIELVNRCLAKKKEERFQSAAEVKGKLDQWLHLHGYTDSRDHLARFVRRNAMRQMRWVDRVIAGEQVEMGPSPFELSNEVPPPTESGKSNTADESLTRAEHAPSRSRADSGLSAASTHNIEAPDTSISQIDEPEATTMRRMRAATITVTNVPEASTRPRDGSPPMGSTGEHSVLDVRTSEDAPSSPPARPSSVAGSVAGEPAPPPRVKPRQTARTKASSQPPGQSLAELRDAAQHICRAAATLADQAQAAAEGARRAADHADIAAKTAKDMARRADRAAKAARKAGEAMDKIARGDDAGAVSAMAEAKALSD